MNGTNIDGKWFLFNSEGYMLLDGSGQMGLRVLLRSKDDGL
jgi:hypothetical protein